MVNSSRLFVGCRVTGCFGPFIEDPNSSRKRRTRERVTGTVIRATDKHKWDVIFDFDGQLKKGISSRSLMIASAGEGIPLASGIEEHENEDNSTEVENSKESGASDCVPADHISPVLNDAIESDEDLHSSSDQDECDDDLKIGPSDHPSQIFTESDFLETQNMHNESMKHVSTYNEAWRQIREMKGKEIVCQSGKKNKDGKVVWKIVEEVDEDVFREIREYEVGLFNKKTVPMFVNDNIDPTLKEGDDYNNTFWRLWPASIDNDLDRLNRGIGKDNIERKKKFQRPIRTVTKAEFIIFHALLIGSSVHSAQGGRLWKEDSLLGVNSKNGKKQRVGLSEKVDFSKYMRLWRFKEIKRYIPITMEDDTIKECDDWWRFKGRVELYNKKRQSEINTSHILVFDESMSAFIPRTTATGGLPNLSYIKRKPEPLGTEFKNLVDGLSGQMVWLEIQDGVDRMSKKEFSNLGGTVACVIRGVKASQDLQHIPLDELTMDIDIEGERPKLFLGDSWFGSVKSVATVGRTGNHACMIVKTAYSRSPKKFLEETMKDFPGGTWITMVGKPEKEEVELVCIGYKYNKKKVLTFVMTKGAGSTRPGEPYQARYPDKYGNVCCRHVSRPEIISNYFKFSNVVDLHNQARQFELALEKKWVTQEAYFRLYTTLVGMNVTDAWKSLRVLGLNDDDTISHFADVLAQEMVDYAGSLEKNNSSSANLITSDTGSLSDKYTNESLTSLSSLSMSKEIKPHTKIYLKNKQVRCIWCSRVNLVEKKTTMMCQECGKGFCRDCSGLSCWSHHVALGGVPAAPARGTKKRKVRECKEEVDD